MRKFYSIFEIGISVQLALGVTIVDLIYVILVKSFLISRLYENVYWKEGKWEVLQPPTH